MEHRYDIEIEPEVKAWLDGLPREHYRAVERHADRLADAPTTLGEPHSRHLSGPVRELRFHLGPDAVRLTYWLAPGRRIVLLTVFKKTRMREEREVQRSLWAQKECDGSHPTATTAYHRTFEEQA
ncbi:type II toxin-antitoxin system RelE/ParE family toxin [Streptomyces sp. NPDC088147]|uniref:type II toxin-antitoxin system RelE/ParE family toxin n=1 Tax=Streptomyces sp. NPDC088147 TaxID=3365830 RepID=UPI0037F2A3FE